MPAIIGALVALLIQGARQYLPGIVGRVLFAFGIGMTMHTIALPALKAFIASKISALTPIMAIYFEATGIGIMFTMILSAIIATVAQRAFLAKLGGGS